MKEIILASRSPRRKSLLSEMGVTFSVQPSGYDEKLDDFRAMEDVAIDLALGKARDVALKNPNAYIIGSDTIVGIKNHQLEKPVDIEDARRMLESYSGHESEVSTGIAVVNINEGVEVTGADTTRVYFKPTTPEIKRLREDYLASGDWKDKAGGYGIQSTRNALIDRIEGNYDTVIGLPTELLAKILNDLGIEAKPVAINPDSKYET